MNGNEERTLVHVPLVHGIGVVGTQRWTALSAARVARWLLASSSGWRREACGAACLIGESRFHEHFSMHPGEGKPTIEAVLDPVTWDDVVPTVTYGRRYKWLTWVVVQVALLYVACGFVRRARRRPGLRPVDVARWALDVVSFIPLSVGVLVFAVFSWAFAAVLALPQVSGCRFDHALAWTFEPESREAIRDAVEGRIASHGDVRLLVGHSQGGSILTDLVDRGRVPQGDQLVTLGTGHGVLEVLRHTRGRGRWFGGGVAVLGALYLAAVMLAMGPTVVLMVLWALNKAWSALTWLGERWLESSGHPVPRGFGENPPLVLEKLNSLVHMGSFPWILVLVGGLLGLVALVGAGGFRRLARQVEEASTPDWPGVDVVASHDAVAAIIAALPRSPRRVVIPQTASLVEDHVRYFRNVECVVRPLERAIVDVAQGRVVDAERFVAESTLHEATVRLAGRRWLKVLLATTTLVGLWYVLVEAGVPFVPAGIVAELASVAAAQIASGFARRAISRGPAVMPDVFVLHRLSHWLCAVLAVVMWGAATSAHLGFAPFGAAAHAYIAVGFALALGVGMDLARHPAGPSLMLAGWISGAVLLLVLGWWAAAVTVAMIAVAGYLVWQRVRASREWVYSGPRP